MPITGIDYLTSRLKLCNTVSSINFYFTTSRPSLWALFVFGVPWTLLSLSLLLLNFLLKLKSNYFPIVSAQQVYNIIFYI